MKKRICALLLAAVLVYMPYALAAAILTPLNHPAAQGTAWAAYEQEAAAQTPGAQRVRVLEHSDEALLWRLRLIGSAREEIIFSSFDLRADGSGQDVMAALREAAARGVRVRVLVDGMNARLNLQGSAALQELAAAENVEVRLYNPVDLLRPGEINYRMHDKYILVDGSLCLLGGRNTNDRFLSRTGQAENDDRDVLVYAPQPDEHCAVRQLENYFAAIWSLEETRPVTGRDSGGTALLERYAALRSGWPKAFEPVDWSGATTPVDGVTLLHNPVSAENKTPELWDALVHLMEQGGDVLVQTPYLICSSAMYDDLRALGGGREIAFVTNSVEGGANLFGCADYLGQKEKILGCGVEVYETLCGHSLHTKAVLVGGRLSVIGSFNMDMRSAYLDTELMLVIDSPEINAQLRGVIADYQASSRLVRPDGTQTEGTAYVDVPLPAGKRALYGVLRYLVRPIRHLL